MPSTKQRKKQRDPVLKQRRTAVYGKRKAAQESAPDNASQFSTLRTRKRRRRDVDRSPLEELPVEVIQLVFEYSANIELPLISTALAKKLRQSSYLQRQLSDRLLNPVLGFEDGAVAPAGDLASATRLLNCRFMTFDFFQSWLQSRSSSTRIDGDDPTAQYDPSLSMQWSALLPSPGLLPPDKLLRPPFTADKVNFLSIFADHVDDIASRDAAHAETAYDGLAAAVQQKQLDVVNIFLGMGLSSSTELLRVAVAEAGCDERLVRLLADSPDVDLLDPVLWAWAEKARTHGDEKGDWLIAFLKEMQMRRDVDT